MTLCLATKGVLCGRGSQLTPPNPFCPILKFDVELLLGRPGGFEVSGSVVPRSPSGFSVDSVLATMPMPRGFQVEGKVVIGTPMSLSVEERKVQAPHGLIVEDTP